jgi:YD repeat-containing protein
VVGNPVNPAVGNKVQIDTDYAGAGPFPLVFRRYYNSLLTPSTALGAQWRHSYERRVLALGGLAQVVRPDGKALTFAAPPAGTSVWIADPDVADILEATSNPAGWTYTTAQGDMVETYDATGRLRTIATRAGLTQTLTYDEQGRLAIVSDPFGRTLTFAYDTQHRLATLTDPAGQPITYHYDDTANHLTGVTYQDTTTQTYLYEHALFPHALTGIVDENGTRFTTYDYDAQGRTTLTEHADGAGKTTLTYNTDGTTTVTDARTTARTYTFQTLHDVVKPTEINQPCSTCGSPESGAVTPHHRAV